MAHTEEEKDLRASAAVSRLTLGQTAMLGEAMALLEAWLTAPGTRRKLERLECVNGKWSIELSAGAFRYDSFSQLSMSGAIRAALQMAAVA